MTVLDQIVDATRRRLPAAKRERTPARLALAADHAPEPRDFVEALRPDERLNVIAEFKPRSPSEGELRDAPDVERIARAYEEAGAAAMSVLTEPRYFGSSLERLERARETCGLPLLRKDFIVDPYQVDEARAAGADALLLIVAALDAAQLTDLVQASLGRGMAPLVEVHDEYELERAMRVEPTLVGINQRDLKTLAIDRERALRVLREVPRSVTRVVESGLERREQLLALRDAGGHAFLIGSHLMKADDPGRALAELIG